MWDIIKFIFPYAIAFTIPLLITSLGGLICERSGVVNIGLEGLMIIGSFASALSISKLYPLMGAGALWVGLLVAAVAGAIFSLLHAFASINLNANQVISGTAINMIAGALTVYFARYITGSGNIQIISGLTRYDVPVLSKIPVLGKLLFTQTYSTTWLVLLILLGTYFLSLLPFFPTSRYRQPVAPLLAISSAVFLVALVKAAPRQRILWVGAAILMTAALLPRWASLDQAEILWQVHLHEASRASKQGQLSTTLAKGRQAEEVRPGLADTPYHLSLYLEDLGARPEAISALQLARTRAPRNRLISYRLGRNLEEMNKLDEAVEAYLQAADLDPIWAYPWLRLGLVYRQMDQPQDALNSMERSLQLGPGHHRARANLASLYAEAGQLETAQQMLTQLTKDYPLYVNGWFNLALVQLRMGHTTEASETLDIAEKLHGLESVQREQIDQLRQVIQRIQGN